MHACSVSSVVSDFLQPYGRSQPGSSVHGILQANILDWVSMASSRGSSWLRDQTWGSCIAGGFFTAEPLEKHPASFIIWPKLLRLLTSLSASSLPTCHGHPFSRPCTCMFHHIPPLLETEPTCHGITSRVSFQPLGLWPIRLLCPWNSLRQEYWCGLPFPSPGDLPDSGIKPGSPVLAGGFLTTEPPAKPPWF